MSLEGLCTGPGYSDCPCRDCFEIAMDGDLCHECKEHDCSPNADEECQRPEAYGADLEEEPIQVSEWVEDRYDDRD